MIFGMKTIALYLVGAFLWVSSGTALAALTTEELTRLKMSGLGEEVIRFMVENGYDNVDRVVKLKEAGFADETISSVIKTDLKAGGEAKVPAPQPVKVQQVQPVAEAAATMQTLAKVRIEQYLAVGEPVVKNSQDISNATISLLQGRRLKIEWDGNPAVSTLDNILRRKPFENPFYWDLDKGDALHSVNPKDNSFILRTGRSHQGSPAADRVHYWIVHVTPSSPDLEKRIRELLSE
jgi:hypothetical protein